MFYDPLMMIILIFSMILSFGASTMLKRRFRKFSKVRIPYSGKEIAERMLQAHGISDVAVISTPGSLTDHYNPMKKTVNLSEAVYDEANIAAAAVAAHEVGHAVQHAQAYRWLTMRSKLVPMVSLSSSLVQWVLLLGVILAAQGSPTVLLVGIVMFALTTLFAFITLPVEFDASKRAIAWIGGSGLVPQDQTSMASNALKWAASTYVVAALASLAQLLYYVMRYMGSSRD